MKTEAPLVLDEESDPLGMKVPAICGVLLGLLVALGAWVAMGPFGPLATVAITCASVGVCAVGATRYGDRFWEGVFELVVWW
jgi:hypothetical protein